MAEKKHSQFFTNRQTALGKTIAGSELNQIVAMLPKTLSSMEKSLLSPEENPVGRNLPLVRIQLQSCLESDGPFSLLKNTIDTFESVLSKAIDNWTNPRFLEKPISQDEVIAKLKSSDKQNILREIALTLKSIYEAYPDQDNILYSQREKLWPILSALEPDRDYTPTP